MVGAIVTSVWLFVRGMAKRFWLVVPTAVLDPADIYNQFIKQPDWPVYNVPVWLFWVVFGLALLSGAVWTYHELRTKYERPKRNDPPDVVATKAAIMVAANAGRSAFHELTPALYASSFVFETTFRDAEAREIARWGITCRNDWVGKFSKAADPDWVRQQSLDEVLDEFVRGLAYYRGAREMLNMVCKLFLTKESLVDTGNYNTNPLRPQTFRAHGDGPKDLSRRMRDWWSADVLLRSQLTTMRMDPRFRRIGNSIEINLTDDPHYKNQYFTEALAKFWKERQ